MKMNESRQQGHFWYPYTMHEKRKEGKPSGKKTPHLNIMQKLRKRKLLGSRVLHLEMILLKSKLLLNEILGEDINSLLGLGKY